MESENRNGIELSKKGLMETFGWTFKKVDRLLRAGCPVVRKGGFNKNGSPRAWAFNSVAVWDFYEEYEAQKRHERAEAQRTGSYLKPLHPRDPRYALAAAQAERITRANAREAAITVGKDDAVEIVGQIFGMIREHFGKLPDAIVGQFSEQLGVPREEAKKVKRLIQREIDSALSGMDARELADAGVPEESESI